MTDILTAMLEKKRIAQQEREAAVVPALLANQELLITIARFDHAGMDDQQIARSIGRSVLEVQAIREHDIYKTQLAETAGIIATREITVDELYAQLELTAVQHMAEYVRHGNDPEYAMRAARIANQAQSRVDKRAKLGSNNLRANADRTNNVTVVLNQQFVERLPHMNFTAERLRADTFDVGVPMRKTPKGMTKIDAVPDAKTAKATIAPVNPMAQQLAADIQALGSFALASERTI